MAEPLDNILSGRTTATTQEPQTEPKETVTQAAPETATTEAPEAGEQTEGGQKMVPHEALHAEKQKVKRYTEQVADFERTVGGLREQNTAFQRQITELLQRLPAQQQPQPKNPWDDLEGAITERSQAHVQPVMQHVQALHNQVAQLQAAQVFGDKLGEFVTYVKQGRDRGDPEIRMLDAMMEASPNPYATAKKWFEARTFDPAAERERMKAELLQELQPNQQQPAPVMPSNLAGARNVGSRAGPAWGGPTPLADIFKR